MQSIRELKGAQNEFGVHLHQNIGVFYESPGRQAGFVAQGVCVGVRGNAFWLILLCQGLTAEKFVARGRNNPKSPDTLHELP